MRVSNAKGKLDDDTKVMANGRNLFQSPSWVSSLLPKMNLVMVDTTHDSLSILEITHKNIQTTLLILEVKQREAKLCITSSGRQNRLLYATNFL